MPITDTRWTYLSFIDINRRAWILIPSGENTDHRQSLLHVISSVIKHSTISTRRPGWSLSRVALHSDPLFILFLYYFWYVDFHSVPVRPCWTTGWHDFSLNDVIELRSVSSRVSDFVLLFSTSVASCGFPESCVRESSVCKQFIYKQLQNDTASPQIRSLLRIYDALTVMLGFWLATLWFRNKYNVATGTSVWYALKTRPQRVFRLYPVYHVPMGSD